MKKKIATKEIILSAIVVLGLIILVYYWYQGSCWKDNRNIFKEIGKPMVQNVLSFYKKYQRYPTHEESKVLFEKTVCTNLRQTGYQESKNAKGEVYRKRGFYDCEYKLKTYQYVLSVVDLLIEHKGVTAAYKISFYKGNTSCTSNFNRDGTSRSEGLGCIQYSCLLKNLSH